MEEADFKWSNSDPCILFRTTQGIAVYVNGLGGITIRQEAFDLGEDDMIVSFPMELAPTIISAIQSAIAENKA